MIFNIIDRRTKPYAWKAVTAIVEPTYHDNTIAGADQAEDDPDSGSYDQRARVSVTDAVAWAHSLPYAATLHLYDLGEGINVVSGRETAHFIESRIRMPDE